MKKIVLLLIVLALVFPVFADEKAEKFPLPEKGSFGLLFNFSNIPIIVEPYSDSILAGAGVKYCITDKFRLRGLLWVSVVDPEVGATTSDFGISVAGEYHFKPGVISPYVGAILGMEMLLVTDEDPMYEPHFGALGGVEIRIIQNFSVYAEYAALFKLDETGMTFDLGKDATLGVIIYFN